MKIFILFILSFLFTSMMFAQISSTKVTSLHNIPLTSGFSAKDSLQTYGNLHASDSVRYVNFNYQYAYHYITIIDTGSVVTDTVKLYKGHINLSNAGTVIDTTWDSEPMPVKDNVFDNVTVLVGANKTKTYTILDWSLGLMKIKRTNVVRKANNVTKYIIDAIKR